MEYSAKKTYEKRVEKFNRYSSKLAKESSKISNLRFADFIFGIGITITLALYKLYIIAAAFFAVAVILFIALVLQHQKVIKAMRYAEVLKKINEDSLKRLGTEWINFDDKGEDFIDFNHRYTSDLDIFGKGSLYQWITSARTPLGRQALARILAGQESVQESAKVSTYKNSNSYKNPEAIKARQEAVKELAAKINFRQRFLAEAEIINGGMLEIDNLKKWAQEKNNTYEKLWFKLLVYLSPIILLILIILAYAAKIIPWYVPIVYLAAHFIFLKYKARERMNTFYTTDLYKENVNVYHKMLKLFETGRFDSKLCLELKERLVDFKGQTANRQIFNLVKIMNSVSDRYNAFYQIFNLFTLWDYRILIAIEKWKSQSGVNIAKWLEVIGEIECLSSLAIIAYDHHDWAFPEFTDSKMVFDGKNMGHPLLSETRVCNDIKIDSSSRILMITGSNMSGKSTLLRTAGINLVLAYSGAPVCAESFRCSIMNIYTCMRVNDNLEKSISSFYAELLRIKMIIEACEEGENIFFLLDEIFKGTNSVDRHTGAKILIKKLSQKEVLGMVSTHDLELGSMEEESKGLVKNYHFREYYRDNKIYFDYKLRPGISTTRNAIYLMKMAGIEMC